MGYTALKAPERIMSSIDQMVEQIQNEFQIKPTTIVHDTTVYHGSSSVFEIATAQLEYSIEYVDEQWSLMSKSTTEIQGSFVAKAGFDMNDGFQMIANDTLIVFRYPPPKILSVDVQGSPQIRRARGLWNPISNDELNNTLALFHQKAEEKAEVDELHLRAEEEFKARLKAIVTSIDPTMHVGFVRNYLTLRTPEG